MDMDDTSIQKEARRRRQSAVFLGEDAVAEKEQGEPARKKVPSPSWADPKEEEGEKRDNIEK